MCAKDLLIHGSIDIVARPKGVRASGLNGKSVRYDDFIRQCRHCPRNGKQLSINKYHCAKAWEGVDSGPGKSWPNCESGDRPLIGGNLADFVTFFLLIPARVVPEVK